MTSQDAHISSVPAGFPSPADDYKANKLDLDELVIHNPQATFYVRVSGDSMKNAGIENGDIVVVDRSLDATHNAIIVAILNGGFTLKRLYDKDGARYLVPANRLYKPIKVTQEMEFQVWGVVTYCIHRVK
jgi:DNA polymerase V